MKIISFVGVFILGGVLSVAGYHFLPSIMQGKAMSHPMDMGDDSASVEEQPLYWVAPMDPNYRRDKPGKSPMGMDLIPFYAAESSAKNSPGTVSISPEVVNNLGVRTSEVFRGVLKPDISTVGYLTYNNDKVTHIHPRVEGWIEKSFVKSNGDYVEKGQALFDLYSPTLVNTQEEFLFALGRKDQRMMKATEERLKALHVPNEFIRTLKSKRRVSQTIRFYAPQSGVVDNLGIQDGVYIKPGTTLMSIADLNEVWLEAEVFERQAHLVEVGQPAEASMDFLPGQVFDSHVDFIYPTLDANSRTLRVRIRLDNAEQLLKPDMFAHVRIQAVSSQPKLLIEKTALIRGGEQNRVVLALGEGRFKSVAVQTGALGSDYVEVLQGLELGDEVVTSAQFLLDSESSKSSDFKRMNILPDQGMQEAMAHVGHVHDTPEPEEQVPDVVWVAAKINHIDADKRILNVNHAEIADWGWPKMTMDFVLADWLEPSELPTGKNVQLEITRESGAEFVVSDYSTTSAEQE
ncbi:efflux RND transporter periplasmic adaptor subunit [Marinomonas sp. C2222]|uniref:Efflux RND transporter periplasmic adaptor subunit n=1 Tax=Marinomonas sargassi TaxID=2984494 RepID=A0ABT2YW85_9GAMM|nr:efflux RND transporter periplasmic adaptor subunit [Marinomonas sargassi]MCV2404123.1 efflux RND transporter periplasmic adaptor subunit [Marinomonas sargassi]